MKRVENTHITMKIAIKAINAIMHEVIIIEVVSCSDMLQSRNITICPKSVS